MKDDAKAVLMRRDLDEVLKKWRRLPGTTPKGGWIRAMRTALCMTAAELAARLGVSQGNVSALEASEVKGTIHLDTLRRTAKALDCALVYGLVPRASLDDILERRRRGIAVLDLAGVLRGKPIKEYHDLITVYAAKIKRNRLWQRLPEHAVVRLAKNITGGATSAADLAEEDAFDIDDEGEDLGAEAEVGE